MSIEKKWDPVGSIGFLSPLGKLREPYGFNNELRKDIPQAASQRCSYRKVLWKYAANLQENTHADMQFQ